jgi:hypothetical protein
MDVEHRCSRELPGKPGPIPFSISSSHQALGILSIMPAVGDSHVVTVELHLGGTRLGSLALTGENALDLALRLVGTIMNRRRAVRTGPTSNILHCLEGAAGDRDPTDMRPSEGP